jgi:hypothetical protein
MDNVQDHMQNSFRILRRRSTALPSVIWLLCIFSSTLYGQPTPLSDPVRNASSNWERVKALSLKTGVHITTDHGGQSCHILAVDDDSLTCAKGGKAGAILQRLEIKHIKLTHYVRSTLVGAAIGGGIGATAGAIGGRTKPCPAGQGLCLNGIGIGAGGVAVIFGVAGGIVGSIVGATTDLSRGSPIYIRP